MGLPNPFSEAKRFVEKNLDDPISFPGKLFGKIGEGFGKVGGSIFGDDFAPFFSLIGEGGGLFSSNPFSILGSAQALRKTLNASPGDPKSPELPPNASEADKMARTKEIAKTLRQQRPGLAGSTRLLRPVSGTGPRAQIEKKIDPKTLAFRAKVDKERKLKEGVAAIRAFAKDTDIGTRRRDELLRDFEKSLG